MKLFGSLTVLFLCLFLTPTANAIYGGKAAGDVASPTVLLKTTRGEFCTGTFISRNRVLTAAHCITGAMKVYWGSDYLYSMKKVTVPRRKIRVMPSFQRRNDGWVDDIATLDLPRKVAPATLPMSNRSLVKGGRGRLIGWGVMETWSAPDHAQTTLAPVWPRNKCVHFLKNSYSDVKKVSIWHCVGYMAGGKPSKAKVPCWGDSGGPLIYRGKIIGVLSWFYPKAVGGARECASTPGVYARTTPRIIRWVKAKRKKASGNTKYPR